MRKTIDGCFRNTTRLLTGAEPAASTLSLPLLLPPLRPPRPASVARLERLPIGLEVYAARYKYE